MGSGSSSSASGTGSRALSGVWFAFSAAVLLALGAWLRFQSIGWGAPFVYHPDEHFVLQPALDIARTGNLNPHWFQYPSLLIYAEALLIRALQPFVGASLESNYLINGIGPWDALPAQWPFVLAGRLLVAVCGVAGIVALAVAGWRLRDSLTGYVAGLFLAVAALHNQSGHYLTTDVPACFWVAMCMAATAASAPRWFVVGLLAGLAAGTKYTAGAVLLTPLLAALDAPPSERGSLWSRIVEVGERWSRIAAGLMIGFLVSTPYALFDVTEFIDGLEAQRQNYYAWAGQTGNLEWYLRYLYETGLGPPLALLAAGGLVFGLVQTGLALRRGEGVGKRLAFLLPPLLYIPWLASYPSRAERNLIVVLPFLCLAAADLYAAIIALVRPRRLVPFAAQVGCVALLWTSLSAINFYNQRLALPDNRTLALEWMRANLPKGARIAREEYTPQIQKGELDVSYVFSLSRRPYAEYLGERVEYLLASSNIYGRAVDPPYIAGESGREFYRVLFGLPLVKEWPQGPYSPGPTIRLYKVPLPPGSRS